MSSLINRIYQKLNEQNFLYDNNTTMLSENMQYHVINNIPIHENIFRMGSKSYFNLINEARDLQEQNKVSFLNENDMWIINNTDLGYYDYYKGKKVPLDYPLEFVINEAEYRGKKVELNKPKRTSGGKKKFVVYTKKPAKKTKRNPKGYTIVKVGFGQPGMKISKNAAARKAFLARHKCDTDPGPKWKARYWSCNIHRYKKQLGLKFPGRW